MFDRWADIQIKILQCGYRQVFRETPQSVPNTLCMAVGLTTLGVRTLQTFTGMRVRVSSGHLCEAEAPTESETRQALRAAIFAQGNALISVSLKCVPL
jgi:hypothetical protein